MKKKQLKRNMRKISQIRRNRFLVLSISFIVICIALYKYMDIFILSEISKAPITSNASTISDNNEEQQNIENSNSNESEENKEPEKTDIVPGSNVTYEGNEYAMPADKVSEIASGKTIDDNKYVFLTFDDGPSHNTESILSILKQEEVKATFFMLGKSLDESDTNKNLARRCIEEGHAIANHSYSHDLKKIYPNNSVNTETYLNEFNKTNNILKSILGDAFDSRITRMPGGYLSRVYYKDPSLPEFDSTLSQNKIVSIDWNSMNGDAEGKNYSSDELFNNAVKYSEGKNQIVILMHDTSRKEKTVSMLQKLIEYYKNNGYEFKTIKSSFNN